MSASKSRRPSMASRARLGLALVALVLLAVLLLHQADPALASGKKKFLKGFILGALLSKSHYPVVYSMAGHGGHGGGGGYGGW